MARLHSSIFNSRGVVVVFIMNVVEVLVDVFVVVVIVLMDVVIFLQTQKLNQDKQRQLKLQNPVYSNERINTGYQSVTKP